MGELHVVVAAALLRDDTALLCHRVSGRTWYPNVWDFPGGHVDPGERAEQALRRELLEEIGVDVGRVDHEPVLYDLDPETNFDLTVWALRSWEGEPRNCQPLEHDGIAWFGVDQIRHLPLASASYLPLLEELLT